MSTEAIVYHESLLRPIAKGAGPIGTLEIAGNSYNYLTHLGEVGEERYWHHFADMPLPKSFQLFDYTFQNGAISTSSFVSLQQAYSARPSKFIVNIRQEGVKKETFDYDQETNSLELAQPLIDASTLAWDYKTLSAATNGLMSCGSKCREGLFYGSGPYKLLVFYTEEDAQDDRKYYIPCLGKVPCHTNSLADVVFYNATLEEVVTNWLTHFHANDINSQPGIADELTSGNIPEKEFTAGGTSVRIKYTKDSSKLFYKPQCKPMNVACP